MAGTDTTFLHPRRGPVPKPSEVVSHDSHGAGDYATGHAVSGNIARDGAPKHVHPVTVHGCEYARNNDPTPEAPQCFEIVRKDQNVPGSRVARNVTPLSKSIFVM